MVQNSISNYIISRITFFQGTILSWSYNPIMRSHSYEHNNELLRLHFLQPQAYEGGYCKGEGHKYKWQRWDYGMRCNSVGGSNKRPMDLLGIVGKIGGGTRDGHLGFVWG